MESEAVRKYFDQNAWKFDGLYRKDSRWKTLFNRAFRRAIYERFAIVLAESGDVQGATILDVGCGSGRYAIAYAQRGAAHVFGIVFAPKMIALAREYAQVAGVADRCQFVCGDFMTIDFPGLFDVVLAVGVFDYLSAPVPFLRRMVELSRCRVIAMFPGPSLVRMRVRRVLYGLRGVGVYFYRQDEIAALARAAGLQEFRVLPVLASGSGSILVGQSAQRDSR